MVESFNELVMTAVDEYVTSARQSFYERVEAWKMDVFDKEVNEVIGGLLARQLSLATNTARSPMVWNEHVLPVLLRCMADVYISFCWVLKDRVPRARQYIEYGLGQEKLAIEKYEELLSNDVNPDPDVVAIIEERSQNLSNERLRFLIPVNLGSWSELSIRDMAIEVGEKQFYDFVFTQLSAPVHSTWQHIWRMNLFPCSNPLHMGHRMPFDPDLPPDCQSFTRAAKYLCMTFDRFDREVLGLENRDDAFISHDQLWQRFADYFNAASREVAQVDDERSDRQVRQRSRKRQTSPPKSGEKSKPKSRSRRSK